MMITVQNYINDFKNSRIENELVIHVQVMIKVLLYSIQKDVIGNQMSPWKIISMNL